MSGSGTLAGLGREGTVIVREQERPVYGLQMMKPTAVVDAVAHRVPFEFNMRHFIQSWKRLGVRPESASNNPQRTDERYCLYDRPHGDYLYTKAFVESSFAVHRPLRAFANSLVRSLASGEKPGTRGESERRVVAWAMRGTTAPQ